MATSTVYPVQLSIDYPELPRNRMTTFFRIFTVIPIGIILSLLAAGAGSYSAAAAGFVVVPNC